MKVQLSEKCPCASGMLYEECCYKDGDKYNSYDYIFSAEKNYLGVPIPMSRKYEEECTNKLTQSIMGLEFDSHRYIILKNVYKTLDQAMTYYNKYSPCKKGCNYCCMYLVITTSLEAELIRQYVDENFTQENKEKVHMKIKANIAKYPRKIDKITKNNPAEEFAKENVECPFLDNGICSIYDVRPIECRKHIAFTEPEYCKDGKNAFGITKTPFIETAYNLLSWTAFKAERGVKFKALPLWFEKGFAKINDFRAFEDNDFERFLDRLYSQADKHTL